jgi:Protein of unknown function (DUF1592)/Protein of unknown function (DUF1588)/Protein of unknown function (DUF1585)/Protein of unknown function (DUF1595)/Protein of unknown function (DUF1587)
MNAVRWVVVAGAAWVAVASASPGETPVVRPRGADLLVSAHRPAAAAVRPTTGSAAQPTAPPVDPDAVVQNFCVDCHNDQNKANTAGVSFDNFTVATLADHRELGERMVRKLRLGMMPPPGNPVPDAASYAALIDTLETRLDATAASQPNPGTRTFPRLNRTEYASAVHEVLGLDVNAGDWLPLDSMSANFDNIADEQMLSATLLEAYLNAASDISRMAVGDLHAPSLDRTYSTSTYESQHPWDHLDGAPFGTRGGIVVKHVFPADAEYVFEPVFISGNNSRFEDLDISVDGTRVALVRYEAQPSGGADGRGGIPMPTNPITIRAGQHVVSAAFVRRFDGPYEDLIRPNDWSFSGGGSGGSGITTLVHLRDLTIRGPFHPTGISDTPTRRKIFTCRPTTTADEPTCARTILAQLSTEAYRRPTTPAEVDALMHFYQAGAAKGDFETGVRTALEAVLASPDFIFRLERQPDTVRPGATYRVGDTELASRLSYFLWGRPPDADLLAAASRGDLSTVAGLEKQARKMLADPRSEALGTRFAAQWLRLQDIDKVHPDPNFYPNFDDELAGAMRKETIIFFNDLVKSNRSALDLYRADYTFVNELLANHYGIPGVAGDEFRRVTYPDDTRRGIFGQGSVLVQTSLANRTSPVLRGKWVMSVLLGSDPPPPPANVPPLDNTAESQGGKVLTTRERIELHRANPACASCHRFMDPIGLALDHFDVTGKWRLHENGSDLDTRGVFYDGTPIATPAELSAVLLKRPVPLVRTLTENLMAFALGRRAEYYDQPTIRAITRAAEAKDYPVQSLILGVITSDAFRLKRAEAVNDTSKGKERP